MGSVLGQLLDQEVGPLPLVGDIRGRGLFWAVEFMLDGPSRIPLPTEAKFCDRVVNRALELGLNILGNLGKTGDVYVDHIIICPPYIVTENELRAIVDLLVQAIRDVTKDLGQWISSCATRSYSVNGHGVNGSATNGRSVNGDC